MSDGGGAITWRGFIGTTSSLIVGGFVGVWALFAYSAASAEKALAAHAAQGHNAISEAEHDRAVRRIERLEYRIDSILRTAAVEIDGETVAGEIFVSPGEQAEYFLAEGLVAKRAPGGAWIILWRRATSGLRRDQK